MPARSVINPHRLTPPEAERVASEYAQFAADGPPYDSPNRWKLKDRDRSTLRALADRARVRCGDGPRSGRMTP